MRRLLATAPVALVALLGLVGCGSEGRVEQAGNVTAGKDMFVQKCGGCHTLADAGTKGVVGPNLDDAFHSVRVKQGFEESTIRDVVRGQIAYPTENPPSGEQGMPANLVTGDDADAVASYVASVAGLPVKEAPGGGGQNATDGKAIFTQNCSSCHTLADAGASGNVGPNLDEAKPDAALVTNRVTNGKGVMPSFKGQLSDAQIKAVAEYVSQNAGK
ncbi:MAG: c-type cytochrome [Pseudomonadota bacterium]